MYFLGIDGGGTKTKVVVINENKDIIYESVAGPSSVDTVSNQQTVDSIQYALNSFYSSQNHVAFDAIFIGLGGIVFDHQKKAIIALLKSLKGVDSKTIIVVENDMHNALYSGLLFDEGMTLICGTGMVAFGKNKDGKYHKSGGWGFKEGDAGSGFNLGSEAIKYMIRAFDHRLSKDAFALELANHLNLKNAEDIISLMDELYLDRTKVASLAPFVTKYANLGHPYAIKIIEKATDELALSVKAVYQQLNLNSTTLVVVGSLGNVQGHFKSLLHEKIKSISSKINIIEPKVDPAYAAAIMASRL